MLWLIDVRVAALYHNKAFKRCAEIFQDLSHDQEFSRSLEYINKKADKAIMQTGVNDDRLC